MVVLVLHQVSPDRLLLEVVAVVVVHVLALHSLAVRVVQVGVAKDKATELQRQPAQQIQAVVAVADIAQAQLLPVQTAVQV
jgi:hypothetical protein